MNGGTWDWKRCRAAPGPWKVMSKVRQPFGAGFDPKSHVPFWFPDPIEDSQDSSDLPGFCLQGTSFKGLPNFQLLSLNTKSAQDDIYHAEFNCIICH